MSQDITQFDANMLVPKAKDGLAWYDIAALRVEGRGWRDVKSHYDRLPARAEGRVTPSVWHLCQHSAGLGVRFVTDATSLSAHWTLRFDSLAMDHMPATGCSGLDLYVHHEGRWRWLGVGRGPQFPESRGQLAANLTPVTPPDTRMYQLYLPLYNGVTQVEIGLPPEAKIAPMPRRAGKPICIYGTSIVQGGCASRPGLAYPAILGRRLDREVYNLGFSGSGRAEPEIADLLAELDPAIFVIDCLPNMSPDVGHALNTDRMEYLVRALRQARPDTPIVVVENIVYQDQFLDQSRYQSYVDRNAAWHAAHERLRAQGIINLHVVAGEQLLGEDGEATVDGTHPNDLGFLRLAQVLEPVLRQLL